ncbi:MAG: class I SAM-dependent methyltransferase [Chloroflexota bacterium]
MDYYALLRQAHVRVQPRAYLEIGMSQGHSLALASCPSLAIDPQPDLTSGQNIVGVKPWLKGYRSTRDGFFAAHDPATALEGLPLDLAFIDGMHLIENVIRDVANCERWSHPGGMLAIHDVYPPDPEWAKREPRARNWTGDVWRIVPCLRQWRPDLDLTLLDATPSGMLIVRNLDPGSRVLTEQFPAIMAGLLGDERPYETQVTGFLAAESPRSTESWLATPATPQAGGA